MDEFETGLSAQPIVAAFRGSQNIDSFDNVRAPAIGRGSFLDLAEIFFESSSEILVYRQGAAAFIGERHGSAVRSVDA